MYDSISISISILTYNRINYLKDLLLSLRRLRYSNLEIIVIDNCSQDDTQKIVTNEFSDVLYYRINKNIGVAARNIGISKSSGDIVITLDDDITGLNDIFISKLINIFTSNDSIGAVCFKVLDSVTGRICNWCHHYKKEEFCDREFLTDEISEGAVAFLRKAVVNAGLYPDYFFISHEGVDLSCRLLDAGYKTIYSPKIEVKHHTAKEGRKNWRRYYYDTRNQFFVSARNYPLLYALKYLVRGQLSMALYSARDGYFIYYLKGFLHGIQMLKKVLPERKQLSKETMEKLKLIELNRPNLFYMIKKRLYQNKVKI